MQNHRIFVLGAALGLSLCLTACAGPAENDTPPEASQPVEILAKAENIQKDSKIICQDGQMLDQLLGKPEPAERDGIKIQKIDSETGEVLDQVVLEQEILSIQDILSGSADSEGD